ncbi:hypothetical protein J6590_084599 [Homalodisca vitripennis]|nr:hypothetical protein J6590_084599 [Homalodisca vitripennis]
MIARCVNNSWSNMSDIFKKMGQRAFGSAGQPAKRPSSPPAGSEPRKVAAPAKDLFKGHNVTSATVSTPKDTLAVPGQCSGLAYPRQEVGGVGARRPDDNIPLAVQRYLCSKKLPFYTHNLGHERSLKGFAVDEVARLRTARGPTRSWMITLTRDKAGRPAAVLPVPRFWSLLRQLQEAEKMRPLGGKSSEDELPQSLVGEGSLLQLWRRSQRQLPWLDRKSRPTKPARDESPEFTEYSESESEAEDDMPQKKKRRRKPRNPANRQPRQPASVADLPVTQWPRATPRQKLEWQPTPATPPQQTEVRLV